MDKANIVKLAKLAKFFEKFIELDSSFVHPDDVRAIRRLHNVSHGDPKEEIIKGIEVVTPYGVYQDSMDFDTFKDQVALVLETLKEKQKMESIDMSQPATRPGPVKSGRIIPLGESAPQEQPSAEPAIMQRTVTIPLSGNGAQGTLFVDSSIKVVNRDQIAILDASGVEISHGGNDGHIKGENISGVVYENGKYTLAAKNYNGNAVIVKYKVQRVSNGS